MNLFNEHLFSATGRLDRARPKKVKPFYRLINGVIRLFTVNDAGVVAEVGSLADTVPRWVKTTTLDYTDFNVAAPFLSVSVYNTLPAGWMIHATVIKHTTNWIGGAITAVTMSLGYTGKETAHGSPFDVFQPVVDISDLGHQEEFKHIVPLWAGDDHDVQVQGVATGANLDALTQGVCEFYLLISKVKS